MINIDISSNTVNTNLIDTSHVTQFVTNMIDILDEEYNELNNLEQMLINAKADTQYSNLSYDFIDEEYNNMGKSISSSINSSMFTKNKINKTENKISSITIDLSRKDDRKLKCFKNFKIK